MAITISICQHEQGSKFLEKMDVLYYKEDWFRFLFNQMLPRIKGPNDFSRFRENNVAFVFLIMIGPLNIIYIHLFVTPFPSVGVTMNIKWKISYPFLKYMCMDKLGNYQ